MAAATILLAAALSFSAIGVVFATAASVQLLLTPGRRRQVVWFAPVGVALLAWYIGFGRFGNHPNPPPTAMNFLVDPLYLLWGLSQSLAGLIGEGGWVGVLLLAAGIIALARYWKRHGPDPFLLGVAAGSVYVLGFTILQMNVSDELRGRIFATMFTLVRFCLLLALTVAPILSQVLDGFSGRWFHRKVLGVSVPGVRLTLWLGGLIIMGAGALAARSLRAERVSSS